VGEQITWTIAVTNLGPSAATTATVTDTLPAIVSFDSASGIDWGCAHAAGTVTCTYTGPSVDAGNSFPAITILATATAPGTATNICAAAGQVPDPDGSPGCEATTPVGSPSIRTIKVDSLDPVQVGDLFDYGIQVINPGPLPFRSTDRITITDQLDPRLELISMQPSEPWICAFEDFNRTITCARDGGPVGEIGFILITVRAMAPGIIENICVAEGVESDDSECVELTDVQAPDAIPVYALNHYALLLMLVIFAGIGVLAQRHRARG
jgi:uncharacterized repeat protein (TIGR01451 family)